MPTGKDVLAVAVKELGVKEMPANSNNVKYNTWYYNRKVYGSAYPWCMVFVQWCYQMAGVKLPLKTASCGALLRFYRTTAPECIVKEPRPGDIVIFDFPGGADTDHTGIVEFVGERTITTIDGNTGVTSDANGGAVMRQTRDKSLVKAYIRPRDLAEENEEDEDVNRFNTMAEIRAYSKDAATAVQKLIKAKALGGTTGKVDAQGIPEGLNLSEDMLRTFVINDRMGLYK